MKTTGPIGQTVKWVNRLLITNYRFASLMILNFTLSYLIFFIVLDFKFLFQKSLGEQAKNFLSADLSVSARRRLNSEELKQLEIVRNESKRESHLFEFFSMVGDVDGSRLVQIRAIDQHYPLYGSLTLGSGNKIVYTSTDKLKQNQIWVYPELLEDLNKKVGDRLKLGESEFIIADTVSQDSTQTFRLGSLAPRVYLLRSDLNQSPLLEKGATLTEAHFFAFDDNRDLETYAEKLFTQFSDPAVQVTSPQKASQETGRAIGYLSDYLSLMALVGLFLSGVGGFFFCSSFLQTTRNEIALWSALGLSHQKIKFNYLVYFLTLNTISFLGAFALSTQIEPWLLSYFESSLPVKIVYTFSATSLSVGFVTLLTLTFLFIWPALDIVNKTQARELLQESDPLADGSAQFQPVYGLFVVIAFLVVSGLLTKSLQTTGFFVGALFSIIILYFGLGFLGSLALSSIANLTRNWPLRWVATSLARRKITALISLVTLGTGFFLTFFIPLLAQLLKSEIQAPAGLKPPALFLFDIQPEQKDPLMELAQKLEIELTQLSPFIRGRLVLINEKEFEKRKSNFFFESKDDEMEDRLRNRGVNLSYRNFLYPSESIVSGQTFRGELPQISIEKRYAERLNIKLNDSLTFEIQGVEIKGRVANIRAVKWTTFAPNFFIIFNEGQLEDAPKTWLATLDSRFNDKAQILRSELLKKFPNISSVDITRTTAQVTQTLNQMTFALQTTGNIVLLAGLIIAASVLIQRVQQISADQLVLWQLGVSRGRRWTLIILEFGIILSTAVVSGFIFALFASRLFAWIFF